MKIIEGFVKRKVMNNTVIVPTGKASEAVKGMIRLNETASFIWDAVEAGKELPEIVSLLQKEYGVSEEEALADATELIEKMKDAGIFE